MERKGNLHYAKYFYLDRVSISLSLSAVFHHIADSTESVTQITKSSFEVVTNWYQSCSFLGKEYIGGRKVLAKERIRSLYTKNPDLVCGKSLN